MRKRIPKLLIASAAVTFLICSCGKPPYQTAEIEPGEPDYPQENPNPVHPLEIVSRIPSDLKVRIIARYIASPDAGGTMQSGLSCQREVGLAVTMPYHLYLPSSYGAQ